MRAFLLAAGLGTRLRPITDAIPKCLVPLRGRPLLDSWLDLLLNAGIERVLINTHHHAAAVEAHVAASPWRDRIALVHEPQLLGTGGALAANRAFFGAEPLLLAHADNLTDFSVSALCAAHAARPAGCLMTMLAFRTDDPQSCGILELDGCRRVVAFHEKTSDPPGDLANGAVYVIEPEVAQLAASLASPAKPFVDFSTEVIPRLLGRMLAWEHLGYHRDIGSPASLARAERDFLYRPPAR